MTTRFVACPACSVKLDCARSGPSMEIGPLLVLGCLDRMLLFLLKKDALLSFREDVPDMTDLICYDRGPLKLFIDLVVTSIFCFSFSSNFLFCRAHSSD